MNHDLGPGTWGGNSARGLSRRFVAKTMPKSWLAAEIVLLAAERDGWKGRALRAEKRAETADADRDSLSRTLDGLVCRG